MNCEIKFINIYIMKCRVNWILFIVTVSLEYVVNNLYWSFWSTVFKDIQKEALNNKEVNFRFYIHFTDNKARNTFII